LYYKLQNMKALLVMLVLGISTFIIIGIPYFTQEYFTLNTFSFFMVVLGSIILGMGFLISIGNSKWMDKLLKK